MNREKFLAALTQALDRVPQKYRYHAALTLTASRIPIGAAVVWQIADGHWLPALALALAGLLTDNLDGRLARYWDVTSWVGRWTDTVSDRVLLASPMIGMAFAGSVSTDVAVMLVMGLVVSDLLAYPCDSYKWDQDLPEAERRGVPEPRTFDKWAELLWRVPAWGGMYLIPVFGLWPHVSHLAYALILENAILIGVAVVWANAREIARLKKNLTG